MKPTPIALVAGRLLMLIGAVLVLWTLTWPWLTLRVESALAGVSFDLRVPFNGAEITALAAANTGLAFKLGDAINEFEQLPMSQSERSVLRRMTTTLEETQRNASRVYTGIASLWLPPLVALMLSLVLLVTNGVLRFRRGWGGAVALMALISLITLALIRLRLDDGIAQLRANPDIRDGLDTLEQAGVALNMSVESSAISALAFSLLILLGSLIETTLPLSWLPQRSAVPSTPPLGGSVLQPAGIIAGNSFVAAAPVSASAPAERVCAACNKPIAATARFCKWCGSQQV